MRSAHHINGFVPRRSPAPDDGGLGLTGDVYNRSTGERIGELCDKALGGAKR